ncbi:amino acid adenylation domain-containing protein [Paenibacillus donghaensis]|uniref:non-ribosomal peptide synthetase n=1 Tax=Paenibacillus donghaensis TaxID=414771 RepID=UPI0018832642|nr:non-ribosomal peptide synthetase [Paenibacillus donghaensis]MBE9913479.1 amino acid adenylation domain-containing protein [Paenibacillus donghaensis]
MEQQVALSALSPDQKQWLKQQMRERKIPATQIPLESRARQGCSFPLSFSQERLWLMEQMVETGSSYHLHQTIRITGRLEQELLEQSLRLLANRHESFRTCFVVEEGAPVQYIANDEAVQIQHFKIPGESMEQRFQNLEEQASLLINEAFSLDRPPLVRVGLFQLSMEEHVLVFVMHHIISDGWSLKLLTEEWIGLYNDLHQGCVPECSVKPYDYPAYAAWQREWMDRDMLQEEVLYWEEQLKGMDPFFTVPADHPRPRQLTYGGKTIKAHVERGKLEALRGAGRATGATLFMTVLAAFNLMLSSYTGKRDIIVGTPTAGRCREETESMIGCFVNNVVLRTDIEQASDFAEVLSRTARTVLGALKHQNVPFETVLDVNHPERDPAYAPLFQIFFIFQQGGESLQHMQGAVCVPQDLPNTSAKFDMTLEVIEHTYELEISLEFNSALYTEETATFFLENYLWLLGQLPLEMHTPLSCLNMLSPLETQRLLAVASGPGVQYPEDVRLYDMANEHARLNPSAPALIFAGETYTYSELMRKSHQLAAYLQHANLGGSSKRIGICASPSLELVVGILGILKSGCAYVPLDPAFPEQRLQYIARHAGLDCILVQNPSLAGIFEGLTFVDIGQDSDCWREEGCHYREPGEEQSDLAYMIYTSGSTGLPKGVPITHRNVVHFLHAMQQMLNIQPEDSLLSVTTSSFDIFVLELFLPLSQGATVIFPESGSSGDAQLLIREIDRYAPTLMQATPVLWKMLILEGWQGSDQMTLLCGGEELQSELAEQLLKRGREVWNLYGPTETTVWSLACRLQANGELRSVPIGRPIGRTRCYILDEEQRMLPMGAVGHLHIGGDGVSPGYHNQDELTAMKFIDNGCLPIGEERLFDTGDLVRWLPDGNMQYFGRADQQIKVRGFRIEPAEIEQRLCAEPEVAAAVVVAAEDAWGGRTLVAYWVATHHAAKTTECSRDWRNKLRETLPAYMVPDRFILLEELPLTPNKKVDRRSLAKRPLSRESGSENYRPPADKLELQLAELWERILNRSPIGMDDHFFDLGGNSLSAVGLLHEMNKEMDAGLTLRELLEHSTVSGVVALLRNRETGGSARQEPWLPRYIASPQDAFEPFPLTEVQMAYWTGRQALDYSKQVATHVYQEMDFEDLELERLERCFQQLIKRHPMLRATIRPDGVQQVLEEVPYYRIETIYASEYTEQACQQVLEEIRQELSHYVHPGTWPMFAIKAVKMAGNVTRLHMSLDLMIADARSFQIILNDWASLYSSHGEELPGLEASFRDYVDSLVSMSSLEAYQLSQSYWMERIDRLPAGPLLPLACSVSAADKPRFRRRKAVLSSEIWGSLRENARKRNMTSSALLLACFAEVLALYAKQPRFLLNLTLFNRLPIHPQLNEVVGDFTTVSLLEVDYSIASPFYKRAQGVQSRLWSDLDHRLYSGIRVTEQLLRRGILTEPVPVVFTSLLDMSTLQPSVSSFDQTFKRRNEELTEARSISQTPQVWLDHQVAERDGELHFNWDSMEQLFPAGMVEEMFEVYCSFLHLLASGTEIWEEVLPLSSRYASHFQHRHQLRLIGEVHDRPPVCQDGVLFKEFERMALEKPEAPAVMAPNRCLSYLELNSLANAAAKELLACGVKPGNLVGIVMHKCWEQIVAVLAILKAGAAYLPIDASLPSERILELLDIGETTAAFVQSGYSGDLPWPQEVMRLEIAEHVDELAPVAVNNWADVEIKPDQLAYVLFTSGSTGKPKGVMIEHRSAINTIMDMNQRFAVGPNDRILSLSSLSFDLSVYDIFGALSVGAAVVLPEPERLRDPSHWLELINEHGVTIWNSVPAFMSMLLAYCRSSALLPKLRLCLLSGDWIPLNLPEEVRLLNPEMQFVSLGGATEASIWSILYPVDVVDPSWSSIPYGVSMSGQRVYVMNMRMEECPAAVPGELYIGGAGVAAGYWKDSEKTESQFVHSPLTGERLYRTGDWGRYGVDGVIEFMGREDLQVKINGYRIELSEIESVLKSYPFVKQAIVLVDEERERKQLQGFIAVDPAKVGTVSEEEIKSFVKSKLPGYMVPRRIQIVEQAPLTINGKIDRQALLKSAAAASDPEDWTPGSLLEEQIVGIWKKLLGVNHVGLDEHFFDIGGNSLKLIQMQAELQSMLNREIPVVDLFRHTTISMLLEYIGRDRNMTAKPMAEAEVAASRAEMRLGARRTRRR